MYEKWEIYIKNKSILHKREEELLKSYTFYKCENMKNFILIFIKILIKKSLVMLTDTYINKCVHFNYNVVSCAIKKINFQQNF